MELHLPTIARSGLLGLTTGARSFSGIAAQVSVTPTGPRQPERALGQPWVKGLLGLVALGEIVGDKLPATPSRLAPPALVGRLGLAGATALLVARAREPGPTIPPSAPVAVGVAVGASLASAFFGHAWRGCAATAVGRDWPGAVAEDVVASALAVLATRS